jgi:hypothetical protein
MLRASVLFGLPALVALLSWGSGGNAPAHSEPVYLPPVMCNTAAEMKRLVLERNQSTTHSMVERKLAWLRAINLVNVPTDPPRCFQAEGSGSLGESVGQVLIDSTVYDIKEAEFNTLWLNGQIVFGHYRLFVLEPRPQFGA